MTFLKHVKWKNGVKTPILTLQELKKLREKLQIQLLALEEKKSDSKSGVIEDPKVNEKIEKNDSQKFFLSSYLYWPVKSTLETSAISDYIKALKIDKPKEKPQVIILCKISCFIYIAKLVQLRM